MRESKGDLIVAALTVSLIVHIGFMIYAKPKVMTRIASGVAHIGRQTPMRVTKAVERPEPVKIAALADVAPTAEAPRAGQLPNPAPLADELAKAAVSQIEKLPVAVSKLPEPPVDKPVFDATLVAKDTLVSAKIPMASIEPPTPASLPEPTFSKAGPSTGSVSMDRVLQAPAFGTDPDSVFLPSRLEEKPARLKVSPPPPAVAFKPTEEVYEKVDEKVVAAEKAAVKQLVEAEQAVDLPKFVTPVVKTAVEGEWRYFKVLVSPRHALPVVPKDIVVLLDASGSIGGERFGSIRKATKKILRSALNSDDRFNLVAFRNRFTYAFRAWQSCSQASFDAADRWLNNQTAHGRTDVFSTIASVLTLPRDPKRPLIALVVTDGDANVGVSETSEILSAFTKLNDGLISVYMYGVKSSANLELINTLTHGNRGESFIFDGWRWNAGDGIEGMCERFRDPVLSDLRIIFSADSKVEAYPTLLRNLYRGEVIEIFARAPRSAQKISFALRGLNGAVAYEGFFTLPVSTAAPDASLPAAWRQEQAIDKRLHP